MQIHLGDTLAKQLTQLHIAQVTYFTKRVLFGKGKIILQHRSTQFMGAAQTKELLVITETAHDEIFSFQRTNHLAVAIADSHTDNPRSQNVVNPVVATAFEV